MKDRLLKDRWIRTFRIFLGLAAAWFLINVCPVTVSAEIAGDDAFSNLTWESVKTENVQTKKSGVVQSICATDDYIICIENSSDTTEDNDVVSAYYKNNTDENGNPVEQYSLAMRVNDYDWEHCNGMTYNPNTDEIYVALYTNKKEENRGCVYVMDPHTLQFKRKFQVASAYNILGIGYVKETDQYVIQGNSENGYSLKLLDSDFNLLQDFGETDISPGTNSQDLTVCGDYIMLFPLTYDQGVSYMNVYSISRGGAKVASVVMDLGNTDSSTKMEPESICEIENGIFLVTVNIVGSDSTRKFGWYRTEIPYYFHVNTSVTNGRISESEDTLTRGQSCIVSYTPDPGYELASVVIDGIEADPEKYGELRVFSDIGNNHSVVVTYIDKPVDEPDIWEYLTPAGTSSVSTSGSEQTDIETEKSRGGFGKQIGSIVRNIGAALRGAWRTVSEKVHSAAAALSEKIDLRILAAVLAAILSVVFIILLRLRHIRKEREKKKKRARMRREQERKAAAKAMAETDAQSEKTDGPVNVEELLREMEEKIEESNKSK